MKKYAILIFVMAFLIGYTVADRGIEPVPETQGVVTSASVNLVGNFAASTDIQWRITDEELGLTAIPPLVPPFGIYESTYTEDTQTHGTGLMLYDKELDVETSGQISGQWNVEATKQIAFIGVDGAHVISSDNVMVDGAAWFDSTADHVICPFASDITTIFPTYCNRAEAGSTIDMTIANVRTTTTDRFVMPSGDHPVELNHDLRVTELVTDVPSVGFTSAYIDVLIQESGEGVPINLYERVEISDEISGDGAITLFEKLMHYESGMVR